MNTGLRFLSALVGGLFLVACSPPPELIGQGLNNISRFDRSTRATELSDVLAGLPIRVAFD